MQRFFFLFLAAFLSGCATAPQLSREEWIALTSRVVPADPEQALRAVERVLTLADGQDTAFMHGRGELSATRRAVTFLVIAASVDYYQWRVRAEPADGGTRLTAQVDVTSSAASGVLVAPGVIAPISTADMAGRPVQYRELYDLFFGRVRSVLGTGDPWQSCSDVAGGLAYEVAAPLCGPGSEDARP